MPNRPRESLPHRVSPTGSRNPIQRQIIAQHLVLTGYGHWLPNDPRGSGSYEIRNPNLEPLGPIHEGRKSIQPPRGELKHFYREAHDRLQFETIWFNDAMRQALARAIAQIITHRGYTVYAFAILSNHAHAVVRAHRDHIAALHESFCTSRDALTPFPNVPLDHPVWSNRPYAVLLHTPEEVRGRIDYVNDNPLKEGLARQNHPFVTAYDNWPLHQTRV